MDKWLKNELYYRGYFLIEYKYCIIILVFWLVIVEFNNLFIFKKNLLKSIWY